jgi:hypothetical protein
MYKGFGDWSGFRWLNKYHNESGTVSLTGTTTLNILPSGGKYNVAKINEDFDATETLKSYRFQEFLINDNKLFDNFLGNIVGGVSAKPTTLGKVIYEKIANFVANNNDIDTCNVNALYSLCEQLNIPISNYNYTYPAGLKRIVDLTSIPHSRLWGTRSKFDRDFDRKGSTSALEAVNLGDQLSVETYIVSAGTPIVSEQLFNREYKIINTMYISGSSTDSGYAASVGLLSAYPLRDYRPQWGWVLQDGISGIDISKFYKFYTYKPKYDDIQLEGTIDWVNPYNTFTETASGMNEWIDADGMIDTMIDYELRSGLNLFESSLSATAPGLQ